MTRFLDGLFGNKKTSAQLRTRRAFRPQLENLEGRVMMTRQAILDFDGGTLSPAQMAVGGWDENPDRTPITANVTVPSFKDLFTSARPQFDFNSDGVVNGTDADVAITAILAQVRQHFAPYDLNIQLGDHVTHQAILSPTDPQVGDVIVMITGGFDTISHASTDGGSIAGIAPWGDLGNEHDEIVWAFGQSVINAGIDQFISNTAQVISHEMGHAFGLDHIKYDVFLPDGQFNRVATQHLMAASYGYSRNFQNLDYDVDVTGAYQSVQNPEFNVGVGKQNAHQYLSHPDVLGPSKGSWVAVLKPGELTISGNDYNNSITVQQFGTFRLLITNSSSYAASGKNFSFTTQTTLIPSNPIVGHNRSSLNPFTTPLNSVVVYAKRGHDTVSLNELTNFVTTTVYGGEGDDTIYGGKGPSTINMLHGEGGRDKLHGAAASDFLFGGSDLDELYGYGGADYLDGGDDLARDILRGGSGTDTYVRYTNLHGFDPYLDTVEDPDNYSLITTKRRRVYA